MPKEPDDVYDQAWMLARNRRFDEALAAYQRALDAGVSQPEEVHLNRAVILAQHLARPAEALAELDRALALDPAYLPAWLNRGNLLEQAGHADGARASYEQALTIDPHNALALSRLPNLRRFSDPRDPLITRLQRAMLQPGRRDAELADLGFGLGKLLDEVGRHDDAMAAYTAANGAGRRAAGPAGRYDAAAKERLVDRLIASFDRKPVPDGAPAPVFICGMFRSGSTLLERVLAAHPRVTAGGELDLIPTLARRHLPPGEDWPLLRDPAGLSAAAAAYRSAVAQRFPAADLVTDKRPDNLLHLGLVKALFPSARIVITQRDPLDNGLSVYFQHLGPTAAYAADLRDVGHWMRQHARLVAHWQAVFGDDVHLLDYDRFVADPEPEARALLAFCGLDWHAGCLDFHRAAGTVQTASQWQVRQPLYRQASGRWRHYARHLGPLRDALGMAATS